MRIIRMMPITSQTRTCPATADALATWLRVRGSFTRAQVVLRAADEISYERGRRAVLVTAPHATAHRRDGRRKDAEAESGALARTLSERLGYGCLTMIGPQTGDPNWDRDHAFRARTARLLDSYAVVLDLHVMRDGHGPDVCLGLGPSPGADTVRVANSCASDACDLGLRCSVNWPFRAQPRTLTAMVQSRSAAGLQVEVAVRNLRPDGAPGRARRLLDWLWTVDAHLAATWG